MYTLLYIIIYRYSTSINKHVDLIGTARTLILDVGVPGRSTLEFILLYAVKNYKQYTSYYNCNTCINSTIQK